MAMHLKIVISPFVPNYQKSQPKQPASSKSNNCSHTKASKWQSKLIYNQRQRSAQRAAMKSRFEPGSVRFAGQESSESQLQYRCHQQCRINWSNYEMKARTNKLGRPRSAALTSSNAGPNPLKATFWNRRRQKTVLLFFYFFFLAFADDATAPKTRSQTLNLQLV